MTMSTDPGQRQFARDEIERRGRRGQLPQLLEPKIGAPELYKRLISLWDLVNAYSLEADALGCIKTASELRDVRRKVRIARNFLSAEGRVR